MDAARLATTVHIGELGLDGRLRPLPGVLPAVLAASRAGVPRVVGPFANTREAQLVEGVEVLGATCLADVLRWHGAEVDAPDLEPVTAPTDAAEAADDVPDLADVIGQPEAVDALIVAAAGGHHLLLSGPPGAGKTMLARRLPGILPPLDDDAALTAACVQIGRVSCRARVCQYV